MSVWVFIGFSIVLHRYYFAVVREEYQLYFCIEIFDLLIDFCPHSDITPGKERT